MRTTLIIVSACCLIWFAGCESTAGNLAAGAAAGFAGSETYKGAQADLAKKKAEAIEAYNLGVEQGAEVQTLEQLKRQIDILTLTQEGLRQAATVASTDWNNPLESQETILGLWGLLGTVVSGWLFKKKGTAEAAVREITRAVDVAKARLEAEPKAVLKEALRAESPATKVMVASVR